MFLSSKTQNADVSILEFQWMWCCCIILRGVLLTGCALVESAVGDSVGHSLLALGLLLITAKLLEGIAVRLRQSSLLAYVAAGLLLGPALKVVEPSAGLDIFFGIGVIFMFFLIGLDEMDVSGLVATVRGRFFLAGFIAFTVPMIMGLSIMLSVVGAPLPNSIAVAGVIALSSLGVVARVLSDLGYLKKSLGLEVFTTVVIVELLGLLVVSFSLQEVNQEGAFSPWRIPILLAEMIAFAVAAWLLASRVFPPLVVRLRRFIGAPQLALGLITGALLLLVAGVEEIGVHGSLGALLLGMALSGLPHRLRADIIPGVRGMAQGLFIPLFFASAGLYFDLSFTQLAPLVIAAVVLVAVLGKFAGAIVGVILARIDRPLAIASGLMGKGVVEIALLLVMLNIDAISAELFSLLTVIMLCFIFLVPPVIGLAIRRAGAGEKAILPRFVVPSFARYALDEVTVGDVVDKSRQFPTAELSVRNFIDMWVVPEQQDYVVVREGNSLAGIVSLPQVRHLPKQQWQDTPLEKLVRSDYPLAFPKEPLDDVLRRMADHNLSVIPVIDSDEGRFIGSITSSDVMSSMIGEKRQAK